MQRVARMSEVTQILELISARDAQAAGRLLPLVYAELRRLASARMSQESPDQTHQPTALVHEAYLRLMKDGQELEWDSRGHFFAAAAEAMRRILIDNARRKSRLKHGGEMVRQTVSDSDLVSEPPDFDSLLALDDALNRLEEEDASLARLVQLRYFGGLTVDDAARALGVSPRTAKRNWVYARAWLRREIEGEG